MTAFLPSRGHRFKDNVVGLAYKSAMCYGSHSVGIVQDSRNRANAVGGTATHELGHLLGMSHDDFEGSRSQLAQHDDMKQSSMLYFRNLQL